MIGLATPLALAGLIALPVLVALYWLRQRSQLHVVSSLFLWRELRLVHSGGRRLEQRERSWLLLLELIICALLVVAAIQPWLPRTTPGQQLVIVLDDSYSMLAGVPDSPRSRAIRAVERELRSRRFARVQWILAGVNNELLGETRSPRSLPDAVQRQWNCLAPTSDLDGALSLAFQVGGRQMSLLVLTDGKPGSQRRLANNVQWRAFGRPRSNSAIVTALRRPDNSRDRSLFEVGNFSGSSIRSVLHVEKNRPRSFAVELAPFAVQELEIELSTGEAEVRATLESDALEEDNTAFLVPADRPPVRVVIEVGAASLRRAVERAVLATAEATMATSRADLVITDRKQRKRNRGEWLLRIQRDAESSPYVGPFVIARAHSLTEGLGFQGVVWSAGKSGFMPGEPIVSAGNVVLMSDKADRLGGHEVHIRINADRSTLLRIPDWPILISNLMRWRQRSLPGPERANVQVGELVNVGFDAEIEEVVVVDPDGSERTTPIVGGRARVLVRAPGVTSVRAGDQVFEIAGNLGNRQESDLSDRVSGSWGGQADTGPQGVSRWSLSWLAALAAVLALLAHQALRHRWQHGVVP